MTTTVRNLEEVLDEIVASEETPERTSPDRWVDAYPQYAHQIKDFLASWTIMHAASAPAVQREPFTATQSLRGMSIVQNLMHEHLKGHGAAQSEIRSFSQRARGLGLDAPTLATKADLGEVVLRKLDRRLIRFGTVPQLAMLRLAEALQTAETAVMTYLQQPPTLALGGRWHAPKAPTASKLESFADAVRTDTTMTDEQKGRWLAVAAAHDEDART